MTDTEPTAETYFDVFGPFDVDSEAIMSGRQQVRLWQEAESGLEGLSAGIGCYLFCLNRGGKLTPWYVGMTVARDGFKGEAFQPHKLEIYRKVLTNHPNHGRPQIMLFPLILRHSGRLGRGKSKRRVIAWLERMLMGFAYWQNPDVENVRDMKFLRNVNVNGLLGKPIVGRPKHSVAHAAQALFGQ